MALEEALRENTQALEKHSTLLQQLFESASANKAGAKDTPKTTKPAADEGDEGEGDKPKRGRGRPPKGEAEPAAATAKGPTLDDFRSKIGDWVGEFDAELFDEDGEAKDDADEKLMRKRENRKAFVRKCFDKLGVTKAPEVTDPEKRAEMLDWIDSKKRGEDPFAKAEDV